MTKHKDRIVEYEEPAETLNSKIKQLAALINRSKNTVVYTGAGISTSADIPDYRGPNGVWTLAFQNKPIDRTVDMVKSNPTFTHMFLKELYKKGKIQHILSQNCDGLHLRSGLPHSCLSEVHGNMYIEICTTCDPVRQYVRPFDCTRESGFKKHKTGRKCDICNGDLHDTIVHFGELGKATWPLNWQGVHDSLEDVDLMICMGSSLNVLKHYTFLWPDKYADTKVVIINLQWTAKDKDAIIKIQGKCDAVMRKLSQTMNIFPGPYCRRCDPVLTIDAKNPTDLMNAVTNCNCGDPVIELSKNDANPSNLLEQPGWWAAEITRMKANTPVAKSPSPELHESGIFLRKRKPIQQRGRKKKPKVETDFEKDIRLAVIELVNRTSGESHTASSHRGRGRPKKKYYCLSIEKEGSFKFEEAEKEMEVKPVVKEERQPDFDFDAEEDAGTSSDESQDEEFKVPRHALANAGWFYPSRKKRGESGETKEWDLLPKRTRKICSAPVTQKLVEEEKVEPLLKHCSSEREIVDDTETTSEETSSISDSPVSVELDSGAEILARSVDAAASSSTFVISAAAGTSAESVPSSYKSVVQTIVVPQVTSTSSFVSPVRSAVRPQMNGFKIGSPGKLTKDDFPDNLFVIFTHLIHSYEEIMTGVTKFLESYKDHPSISSFSIKDLITFGKKIRPAQNGHRQYSYGGNRSTVRNTGSPHNGSR